MSNRLALICLFLIPFQHLRANVSVANKPATPARQLFNDAEKVAQKYHGNGLLGTSPNGLAANQLGNHGYPGRPGGTLLNHGQPAEPKMISPGLRKLFGNGNVDEDPTVEENELIEALRRRAMQLFKYDCEDEIYRWESDQVNMWHERSSDFTRAFKNLAETCQNAAKEDQRQAVVEKRRAAARKKSQAKKQKQAAFKAKAEKKDEVRDLSSYSFDSLAEEETNEQEGVLSREASGEDFNLDKTEDDSENDGFEDDFEDDDFEDADFGDDDYEDDLDEDIDAEDIPVEEDFGDEEDSADEEEDPEDGEDPEDEEDL